MEHINGSSKLTISYSKYQRIPLPFWDDESDDDVNLNVDDTKRDVDSYETADKELGIIPRFVYIHCLIDSTPFIVKYINTVFSGLYFKHITIVNDDSSLLQHDQQLQL